MAVTQKKRAIQVFSPLGEDVLWFYRMRCSERLARPYEFELEALSEDPAIAPSDLLGQIVTVQLTLPDNTPRYFNGYVSRFGQYGTVGAFPCYRLTLRSWFWLLSLTANCRIFQQKTVPDIVKQVFRDQGFSDFKENLNGSYRQREYCVQYRESDFNFVSRLLEEEGIYYYFTFEKDKHTLVLADGIGAHAPTSGYAEIPYFDPGNPERRRRDHIYEWSFTNELQTGKFATTDYDFKKPKSNLLVKSAVQRSHPQAEFECFDYPGEYLETSEGEGYARCRIEELHARYERLAGKGNARGLATGALFSLTGHPRQDQNRDFLVTSSEYELNSDEYFASGAGTQEDICRCAFTALEQNTPFRPERTTSKPIVQGPQTAVVVGPSGEEIYTDKYGRVKVHFHWDRKDRWESGKQDQDASCWVRVSHPWAGKNWGMVAIPRIGQEVIVDFLEGDPDQPIITGRVYNADQMPPYALPANMTQTGTLTRSTKEGSGSTCNELRFEDKKGSEQVFLHAEKNQDIEVENDETHWVGHDRTKTIDHDETTHVKHDRTEMVDNNETITIGVNRTEMVGSNETITIGANRTESVGQNETITIALTRTRAVGVNEAIAIGAAQEIAIGAAQTLNVGATRSVSVGASQDVSIGTSLSEDIGTDQSTNVGKNRSTSVGQDDALKVGKNLMIDAGDSVTIKTGKASITMKKDGTITIQGKDITIKGSGEINAKADKDVVIKGKNVLQN